MNWRGLTTTFDKIGKFRFRVSVLIVISIISFSAADFIKSALKLYATVDQYEAGWRLGYGIASAIGITCGYFLFSTFRTRYRIQIHDTVLITLIVVLLSVKVVTYNLDILSLERVAPLHATVLATGLWEEFMFRALLLRFFLLFGQKVRISVFVSSLCFAGIHYPVNSGTEAERLTQVLFAFAIGVVFSLTVLKTHHIYHVVLLHALNNFSMGYTNGVRYELVPVGLSAVMAIAACVMLIYARSSIVNVDDLFISDRIDKLKRAVSSQRAQ